MECARENGTIISYDLNYRPSLWKSFGGTERAMEVNRRIAELVDVMIGNEEDFTAALGFEVEGVDENLSKLAPANFKNKIENIFEALSDCQNHIEKETVAETVLQEYFR